MPVFLPRRLPGDRPHTRQEGARFAVLTFAAINLLNFADRYVPASVKHLVKEDLHLSDVETSLPVTGMVIVYMIFSMIFGWLADRNLADRRLILAGAIAFWSAATALAGLAQNFIQLVVLRSLVGVGEAAYMAIAPVMIADFYPPSERNMAFTIFSVTMPIGSALGFVIGGGLGAWFGWRVAFLACGAPGLLVAFFILLIDDPVRGINDVDIGSDKKHRAALGDYIRIATNPAYALATAGSAANSFSVGALADWYGELLARRVGSSVASVGLVLGAATAAGGLGGCLLGAKTTERLESRCKNTAFLIPAMYMLPAALLAGMAVNLVEHKHLAYACICLGEIFMFTYIAPISSVSISVIPVELRSRSAGLQIFVSHILGDVISPPIVGRISDMTGSLKDALQVSWVMLLVCGMWWFLAATCLAPLPCFERAEEASFGSLLCDPADRGSSQKSESSEADSTSLGSSLDSSTKAGEESD